MQPQAMNVATDPPTVSSGGSSRSSKMIKAKSARSLLGGMSTMRTSLRKMGSFKKTDTGANFNKSMSHMEFYSDSEDNSNEEEEGQDSFSLWQEESAAEGSGEDDDITRGDAAGSEDNKDNIRVARTLEENKTGKNGGSRISPPASPSSPTCVNLESDDSAEAPVAPLITKKKALSPIPAVMPSRLSRRQAYKKSKSVGQLNSLKALDNSHSRRSSRSDDMDYKAMASLRVRRPSVEDRRDKRNSMRKCKSLRGFGAEAAADPEMLDLQQKFQVSPIKKMTASKTSSASPPTMQRRLTSSRRDKYRRSKSASMLVSSSSRKFDGDDPLDEDADFLNLSKQQKSPVEKKTSSTASSPTNRRRSKSSSRREEYRRSKSASNLGISAESRLDDRSEGEDAKRKIKMLASPGKASPSIVRPRRTPLRKAVTFDERLRAANAKSKRRSSSAGTGLQRIPRRSSDDVLDEMPARVSSSAALQRIPRRKSDGFLDDAPEAAKKKKGFPKRIPPKSNSRKGRLMEPCSQPPAPQSFLLKKKASTQPLSLGQGLRNLGHIRVPDMLDQSGRSAGSGSISSLSMSSRMFADDSSITSSSKRARFRRAYSSPKLLFKSTVFDEEDDEEEEDNNNTGRRTSTSRWTTTSDDGPVQPSKDAVSVCGSATGPAWTDAELNIPDTPTCSVQTGFVSELTTPSMASIHSTLLYGDEKGDSRNERPRINRCHSVASFVSSDGSRQQTPSMSSRTKDTGETKDGAPKRPARRTSIY